MKKGIRRLLVAMAVCAGVVGLAPPAVWGAGSGHPGTRKGLGLCRLRFGRSHLYRVAFHRLAVSGLIVMADLGNGHEDIVEGNRFWDVITVFYGEGDGRIGRIQSFPLTKPLPAYDNGIRSLVVADLGNGHPDIVATSPNWIYVLYGTGGGRFGPVKSFPVRNAYSLVVADLGNGHPDILTGVGGDEVAVLYGTGGGRFGPVKKFPVGHGVYSLVVADLGNGYPDILSAGGKRVTVLYGTGGGRIGRIVSFPITTNESQSNWFQFRVVDLGNGHPDIVVSTEDTVTVLYGTGGGKFGLVKRFPVGKHVRVISLLVTDLGNGHPDIVIGVARKSAGARGHIEVRVLYGIGGGRFGSWKNYPVPVYASVYTSYLVTPLRVVRMRNGQRALVVAGPMGPFEKANSVVKVLYEVGGGRLELSSRSYGVAKRETPLDLWVGYLRDGTPVLLMRLDRGYGEDFLSGRMAVLYGKGGGVCSSSRGFRKVGGGR